MSADDTGTFHALLIGIDNYPDAPLSGCVNDVDRVAAFLKDRLGVSATSIRKIVAPAAGARPVAADERTPVYSVLVEELKALAGPAVQPGDRILIYYSGHGAFQRMAEAETYFEGLVPLDFGQVGLLFDVELNSLLQGIADRSGDLSVVLDCCHSAGATREVTPEKDTGRTRDEVRTRCMSIEHDAPARQLLGLGRGMEQSAPSASADSRAYTVVAACHADEKAAECRIPPKTGEVHGLLTSCLFELLDTIEPQALGKLRFSDFWETLKGRVFKANPGQRPQILGPRERRVFGGPWQPQDTGYPVRSVDGSYLLAAGSLAGLGKGAELAIYGPEPARFPALNSSADLAARIGVLVIDTVQPAQATARPRDGATPLTIPSGARGRLIKQGEPDLLRVAVSQSLDPEVNRLLVQNQAFDRFLLLPEDDASAEVQVGQYPNRDIWIGDDLNGPGAPVDPSAPGPMGQVRRSQARDSEDMANGLRAGLNHYAQYVIPIRAYRNGGFTLPPNAIEVRVLDANDESQRQEMVRDARFRHEARRDERGSYRITSGDAIAIHIQNRLSVDLHASVFLCNLEGQIELIDTDVAIRAKSGQIFWHENITGQPFELETPSGFGWGIDRLIVIATDQKGMDLSMLDQKDTLNTVIRESMGTKSLRSKARNPAGLRWMAAQVLIQIGGP